jgi:hypothetical protein
MQLLHVSCKNNKGKVYYEVENRVEEVNQNKVLLLSTGKREEAAKNTDHKLFSNFKLFCIL